MVLFLVANTAAKNVGWLGLVQSVAACGRANKTADVDKGGVGIVNISS